ncbi:MAG: ATP-binding protein [Armatimonadota bacterium]
MPVGTDASGASDSEEALKRARDRVARLEGLLAASTLISSTLGRSELLRLLMELASQVVGAESSSVILVDEETNELYFEVALGEKGEEVRRHRLKMGEGIAGWVAEQRAPLLVEDATLDPRWKRSIGETIGYVPKSVLCVPLEARGKLIGVVQVLDKMGAESFTLDDQELLCAFASQAAVAIDNAALYERLRERISLANAELIETNRELMLEKGRLEALVRGMADGLVVTDAAGYISLVNPAAELMLGVREADVRGRRVEECLGPPALVRLIRRVARGTDASRRAEITIEQPERKILSAYATTVRAPEGDVARVLVALSDVTALKELSEMKTEFVSLVSHELRTPLTSIRGFVSLLASDDADEESRAGFCTIVQDECDRLLRLVNGLLDITRLEAGVPLTLDVARVDLGQLIQKAVKAQHTYTDRHTFVLDVPDHLSPIDADEDRVDQIVLNLLSNAVKYSPNGGEVRVSVEDRGDHVVVAVSDEGIGLSPEDLETVFDRYARIDTRSTRKIRGTGLGLFLSKQLVELHGGRIWAESRPETGSTFAFSLPKRQPDEADRDAAGEALHVEANARGGRPLPA